MTTTTVHVHDDTPCDRPAQYAGDPFCGHGATVAEVWTD